MRRPYRINKIIAKQKLSIENYVDSVISKTGFPPTYREVGKKFDLAPNSAYVRCKDFRDKMQKRVPKVNQINLVLEKIEKEIQSFIDATDNKFIIKAHKVDLDIIKRHKTTL